MILGTKLFDRRSGSHQVIRDFTLPAEPGPNDIKRIPGVEMSCGVRTGTKSIKTGGTRRVAGFYRHTQSPHQARAHGGNGGRVSRGEDMINHCVLPSLLFTTPLHNNFLNFEITPQHIV